MEQWKDVKGYEDYYEVSDLGRVRNKVRETILTPSRNTKGYLRVDLMYLERKSVSVHQLVMTNFDSDGYFEGAEVDHINGDKTNNKRENLEWVTHDDNMRRWAVRNGETFIAVSPDGEEFEYAIQADICRDQPQLDFRHVSACLQGKLAQHKGWKFYYKSEGKPRMTAQKKGNSNKKAIATSPDGTAYEFLNQRIFAEERNLSRRQINACLNGRSGSHKGWTFHYKEEN